MIRLNFLQVVWISTTIIHIRKGILGTTSEIFDTSYQLSFARREFGRVYSKISIISGTLSVSMSRGAMHL